MRFLTAINIIGLRAAEIDEWSHALTCPWCGEQGWSAADFFQCSGPACPAQATSAEDLLALEMGGYGKAAAWMEKHSIPAGPEWALRRRAQRSVMDAWVGLCQTPPTSEAARVMSRMRARGSSIHHSRFNARVLDGLQMAALLSLAKETGASYPDAWDDQPPGISTVFCAQSQPHTVDRLIAVSNRGSVGEIVWRRFTAGFVSLIGLDPRVPRLLAASPQAAQRLQHARAILGMREPVVAAVTDLYRGAPPPRWNIPCRVLVAAPRYCSPQHDPSHQDPRDIVSLQQALDQFPGMEQHVGGMPYDWAVDLQPKSKAVTFDELRFALLMDLIPGRATQIPPACASILEQTGTREDDVAAMLAIFRKRGRYLLAEDVERLSLTKVVHEDRGATVRETACDYQMTRGRDTLLLANFSLRIHSSVVFPNQEVDRYCQGTIRCGAAKADVIFSQSLLNDKIGSLESELQRQLAAAGQAGNPTVIEVSKFRAFILPHLRGQAAKADPIHGVDRLGWSDDRREFVFPGFRITEGGEERTSDILCPQVSALSKFRAKDPDGWPEACPSGLDASGRDMVAILVAACVRYFRRSATKAIHVAQSSAALTLLDRISKAFGQHTIFTLNPNARKGAQIEGVHGYPLLVAGPKQLSLGGSEPPYIHLADQGYTLPHQTTPGEAALAAQAAQHLLKAAASWCVRTGGDDFREARSIMHHRSLLREGGWLIEHMLGGGEWPTSDSGPTAIEDLLGQIPYEEAGRRITLIDGQELSIDIYGLEHDRDGIMREARDMGTIAAVENDKLISPAARLLPSIADYYGQAPDVTVI